MSGNRLDHVALLLAVGVPVGGMVITLGSVALIIYGPEALGENAVVSVLLHLIAVGGIILVFFTGIAYGGFLVFIAAGFLPVAGLSLLWVAMEEHALHQRGRTTICTVRDVDKHAFSNSNEKHAFSIGAGRIPYNPFPHNPVPHDPFPHHNPPPSDEDVYEYELACAEPRIRNMTTSTRVADPGERIEIFYDPADRIEKRPADEVGDPDWKFVLGSILYGAGIVLRLLNGSDLDF